jgi:hypothetical protein
MTRDTLKGYVLEWSCGRIKDNDLFNAVQEYFLGGKPLVSRSPLFGIFSFAGDRYVGYWLNREEAEKVLQSEYNETEWYVDEMVCQDCG